MGQDLEWHWCWVTPKKRIRRALSVKQCMTCRKSSKSHHCGAVDDYELALKDYAADECAHCTPRNKRGQFPEGPTQRTKPVVTPKPVVQKAPKTRTGKRYATTLKKASRKTLALLCIVNEVSTVAEIRKRMRLFGADVHDRTLRSDLEELHKEKWIVRHKVDRLVSKHASHMRDWQWCYTVNKAVIERIRDE